ncbi:hypothetical protein Rmet_6679 (plasmid) [Cupriavidus metallidurans CH34]|uniref:Uncharacterized protein n=1 Tax=Cupriavidus metallidurans (strain ATCC 43123 / DSM 2839 / NBRC 102507 / CH34) TaxID=266264 RepID=D3DY97_CUPMC|nr:hypothetical protein Rmet_6679 [Cupriavidus metallidurans CH34]
MTSAMSVCLSSEPFPRQRADSSGHRGDELWMTAMGRFPTPRVNREEAKKKPSGREE